MDIQRGVAQPATANTAAPFFHGRSNDIYEFHLPHAAFGPPLHRSQVVARTALFAVVCRISAWTGRGPADIKAARHRHGASRRAKGAGLRPRALLAGASRRAKGAGLRPRALLAGRPSEDNSQDGGLVLIKISFDSRAETITPVSAAPRARRQTALPSCRRRRAASGRGWRATAPR